MQMKTEKGEEDEHLPDALTGGGVKAELGMGRLVMTVDGQQKQLSFCQIDLLSTATMFDGDRVSSCPLSTGAGPEDAPLTGLFCAGTLQHRHTPRHQSRAGHLCGGPPRVLSGVQRAATARKTRPSQNEASSKWNRGGFSTGWGCPLATRETLFPMFSVM